MINKNKLLKDAKIELAKRNFYFFCRIKAPKFFKDDREYLKTLCDTLQAFYESKDSLLIINLPPRMGKSYTLTLFEQWVMGKAPYTKIISISYNKMLSTQFSKNVRDGIAEERDGDNITYSDIFDTKIKKGDSSVEKWSVEGSNLKNFIASSPTGSLTGYGSDIFVIDDLVKNSEEAFNSNVLDRHWNFFTNTAMSRIEAGGKIIVVFTRWAKGDLVGRLENFYKENGLTYRKLSMKAEKEDGSSLCEELLPKDRIKLLKAIVSEEIFNANYNQIPMDLKGRLYTRFNTYKPKEIFKSDEDGNIIYDFDRTLTYCDTADKGKDYLCSITAGIKDNKIYIIDVIYTKATMEITEVEVSKALKEFNVEICRVESNNGGRGWARNIERLSRELGNTTTKITTFTQSKTKNSRILSHKEDVMNNVYYPEGWSTKFDEFFRAITEYQAEGKNKNDDGPDALTGVYESFEALGYYK